MLATEDGRSGKEVRVEVDLRESRPGSPAVARRTASRSARRCGAPTPARRRAEPPARPAHHDDDHDGPHDANQCRLQETPCGDYRLCRFMTVAECTAAGSIGVGPGDCPT